VDASESDGDSRPLDPPDVRATVAEIEREARARRRAGEIPATYERELDALFASIAPVGARFDSVEAVLAQTERIAGFDVTAPTASNIRGGALVKRGLQRAVGWQFHFFAGQVQAFAYSTLRAFRLLTDRVVELERRLPITDPRVEAMLSIDRDHLDLGPWLDRIPEWCAGRPGRVLHAESATGALVVALNAAGIDAYGVDPRDDAGAAADTAGAETRTTGALDHLRALPPSALGGLVLSGCIDRFALGDQLELAKHAMRVLAPGGRLVVLGSHPRHWMLHGDPVTADLTFGRPLHPETWTHVIGGLGFDAVERHDGARPTLGARANLSPEVVAAFAEIEPLLFPPEAFAITAERPAEPNELDLSA
jgi:SAM-dependent methyltransferase